MNSEKNSPSTTQNVGFVSTSNYALEFFLRSYIKELSKAGQIVLIANCKHGVPNQRPNVKFIEFPFKRKPHPLYDLIHLFKLCQTIRKNRLQVVYTISPKGGVLGMLAATIMRVPVRVHFFTGQVWVTKKGVWRRILKGIDQVIGRMCTFALVDSPSQRDFLISESIVTPERSTVLGSGSVAGVDTNRFRASDEVRRSVREQLAIPQDVNLLMFMGRLTRDKGVQDLLIAYKKIVNEHSNLGLIFVGTDEGMLSILKSEIEESDLKNVWFAGQTSQPERYLAAADIFCLPSYREGFGMVVLEAASTGVPSVGSDIYGLRDAIVEGQTGLLHEAGNPDNLARCLNIVLNDMPHRLAMGTAAAKRARTEFSRETMLEKFKDFHKSQITP